MLMPHVLPFLHVCTVSDHSYLIPVPNFDTGNVDGWLRGKLINSEIGKVVLPQEGVGDQLTCCLKLRKPSSCFLSCKYGRAFVLLAWACLYHHISAHAVLFLFGSRDVEGLWEVRRLPGEKRCLGCVEFCFVYTVLCFPTLPNVCFALTKT